MKERNIPPYPNAGDYIFIAHPTTFRTYKNDLESVKQYTETGLGHIFDGEIGATRAFATSSRPSSRRAAPTTRPRSMRTRRRRRLEQRALSSWAFYMGGDTVTEAVCIPEEIRAKIPGDYGRSKGMAWYYLGGFGLVHDDANNARVVMWDSAA
jgi:hypothetical protein